jgi:hypothetical protein
VIVTTSLPGCPPWIVISAPPPALPAVVGSPSLPKLGDTTPLGTALVRVRAELEDALRRIDRRRRVVLEPDRGRPDGRRGDARGVARIAAHVALVAIEHAVLVAVDAHAEPGAGRDAGVRELLPGRRRQGAQVGIGADVAGAIHLERAVGQAIAAARLAADGALHDDLALERVVALDHEVEARIHDRRVRRIERRLLADDRVHVRVEHHDESSRSACSWFVSEKTLAPRKRRTVSMLPSWRMPKPRTLRPAWRVLRTAEHADLGVHVPEMRDLERLRLSLERAEALVPNSPSDGSVAWHPLQLKDDVGDPAEEEIVSLLLVRVQRVVQAPIRIRRIG